MNSAITASIFTTFLVFGVVLAHADTTNGGDDSTQPVVVTSSASASTAVTNGTDDTNPTITNIGGSSVGVSTTISNGSDDTNPVITNSGGSSGSSATTISNGSDDTNSGSTPVTPVTPPVIVSGGGGGGSSFGGSSSGGSSIVLLATSTTSTINSCPLLTSYLQFGANNNPLEVSKLQIFLKDSQGINVTVNGAFDLQTENAVRAFQSKYMSQIMGPWGATQSSGYAYITTLKKINEIACNTPLTLSPSELAIINAYKDQQDLNNQNGTAVGTSTNPNASTTPLIPLIGQNSTGVAALTATVASFAGAWNNFWGSVWKGITKIF